MARQHVHILTYCREEELAYGSELIFKTLRTGFPSARVSVLDNCSLHSVQGRLRALALENDCEFRSIEGESIPHERYLEGTLRDAASKQEGPLVFLDPDVILWKSCEDFEIEGLMAGALVREFNERVFETITLPRLHTSFLWIPEPRELWREIEAVRRRRGDFRPFLPYSCVVDGRWVRFDTGASLYAALPERMSPFTWEQRESYEHIYCGSHLDRLLPDFDEEARRMMTSVHACAKSGDLEALRGIWRYQAAVFSRSEASRGGDGCTT